MKRHGPFGSSLINWICVWLLWRWKSALLVNGACGSCYWTWLLFWASCKVKNNNSQLLTSMMSLYLNNYKKIYKGLCGFGGSEISEDLGLNMFEESLQMEIWGLFRRTLTWRIEGIEILWKRANMNTSRNWGLDMFEEIWHVERWRLEEDSPCIRILTIKSLKKMKFVYQKSQYIQKKLVREFDILECNLYIRNPREIYMLRILENYLPHLIYCKC